MNQEELPDPWVHPNADKSPQCAGIHVPECFSSAVLKNEQGGRGGDAGPAAYHCAASQPTWTHRRGRYQLKGPSSKEECVER